MGGTPSEPPLDTVDTVDRADYRLAVSRFSCLRQPAVALDNLRQPTPPCDLPKGVGCLTYRRCPHARDKRAPRPPPRSSRAIPVLALSFHSSKTGNYLYLETYRLIRAVKARVRTSSPPREPALRSSRSSGQRQLQRSSSPGLSVEKVSLRSDLVVDGPRHPVFSHRRHTTGTHEAPSLYRRTTVTTDIGRWAAYGSLSAVLAGDRDGTPRCCDTCRGVSITSLHYT